MKPSIKAVKLAIRGLPTGSEAYQHAYKATMERICSQDPDPQRLAKLALSWLTCARETLTLTELQYALAVEPGSCEFDENLPDIEALMSSYAGLVAFDEKSHIIRLVHYKTQHYLEKTWKLWFPNAHADIAETCLTYLSYNVFGELPENDDSDIDLWTKIYPLHNYSARNWSYHYREQSAPKDLVLWFLEKERNVSHALRELAYTEEGYDAGLEYVPKKNTGLHLTAYLGLESLTEELLHTIHPDVANDHLETPLALASRRGYEGTVRILLARGATVDSRDKDEQTPLFQVAHGNHETTVKTLLDWGADPGAEDKRGNKPFFQTTAFKHERICGLLLQRSQQALQLTPKNSLKSTLQLAARNGSLGIVKLILDSGGDPNCIAAEWSNKLLDAPVSLAAKNGHTTVVELLLSRISGSDLVQQLGQTALRLSAACGKRETVRLLISKVANLNETHLWSITALMNAIIEDHADIVELLLHHGACPNVTVPPGELIQYTKGSYGSTMLPKGQFRLRTHIEKLRNRSMDINTLSLAAEGGNKAIITCLVRHNAAPPVQGQGSLSWACQYGYYCLVETLLEEGAEPNWANSNLEAPIIEAAKNGNYEILDVLLRHGASAEASDLSGRTALSMAAELGYEEIVRRLLDFGVSGRQMDLTGQTPLSYAMDNGHESIFKLLAHHDHLTLLIPDIFGRTPLLFWAEFALEIPSAPHTLREFGLESPSNILAHEMKRVDKAISSMEDAACVQHVGKCLLWAINNGHREVATQLLRQGAGPNYQNSAGNTPLVLAAQKNDEFMNTSADCQEAVMWQAVHSGNEPVVSALLSMGISSDLTQRMLVKAAFSRDDHIITALLKSLDKPFTPDETSLSLIFLASWKGQDELLHFMLNHGAGPNTRMTAKLSCRHWDISWELNESETPLIVAARYGHGILVRCLLKHNADPALRNNENMTPLLIAIKGCHHEAAVALLERGFFCNSTGEKRTLFMESVKSGVTSAVLKLLDEGEVCVHMEDGSPLCWAAQGGHIEVVRLLLNAGANPNCKPTTGSLAGQTPLTLAVLSEKNAIIANSLLLAGADPDMQNDRGQTPLSLAAENGFMNATKVLLKHAATVDITDSNNRAPIFFATLNGYREAVKILLDHGSVAADLATVAKRTALLVAQDAGLQDIVAILNRESGPLNHDIKRKCGWMYKQVYITVVN
ncbi:ankyrin repeat-containing domain protein [Aspergillus egyptiacus]|nr:ankyrin repeat-containing domain protein [Aspergillus egyptiacus]